MKKLFFLILITVSIFMGVIQSHASDTELFTTQARPNILILLDDSNSMDEDFYGNGVGSFSSNSKSVHGKKALRDIIDQFKSKLRFGLMAYKVSGVSSYLIHNSPYFVSYEPKSYCPNPPPECVTYAQTGNAGAKATCETECKKDNPSFDAAYLDEIITNYGVGSEQRNRYSNLVYPHTQRMKNPKDTSNYIYYKHAYPMYSGSNWGTSFCYSTAYNPNESTPWDSYSCYKTKTGTNDDYPTGYSEFWFNSTFIPTDTDYALGYQDFGRRLQWYYVGKTWFSNSSPGDGYLHVAVDNLLDKNGDPTATYTTLWNKLDPKENDETGYMSCGAGDKNTCSYVINAGLTPTAGTLETSTKYFKGVGGYTSPIEAWCQKNFIIYVTDGLPSVDESGTPKSADTLMPTVLTKIDNLRNISTTIKGKSYNFDVKTYVLGVGLSDEAKPKLDDMAIHGGTDVGGKAYYADKPEELNSGLANIFQSILESAYSFASPSVPSVRTDDTEDYRAYIASFTPSTENPFWPGNLKAYQLNSDGTFPVDANGEPINAPIWSSSIPDSGSRVIKTYVGGALKDFTSANLTKEDLDVGSDAEKNALISYIRNLGLGDIFHSNSVIVGAPSQFYIEEGYSGTGGFYENKKSREKIIIVGANDGILHAFDADTGVEKWAFIPNSLLKNLKTMQTTHTYYVDSTPKVADVWFGDLNSNTKKDPNEWKTVLVCGLRKGGKYYFALDITDTLNPKYLWEFPKAGDATTLAKLGESWSEPAIGRVKIEKDGNLVEKWVAFIGGGFDPSETKSKDADIGKAFFVIDISNGDIIWEFSYDKDHDVKKKMTHALAAPPTVVDTNLDGYIDQVYIGDLGGQMWVFDVSFDAVSKKSNSLWTDKAKILFQAPSGGGEKHRIYYQPAVGFDQNRKPWVYFGTGDREDPKDWSNTQERFYAIKDDGSGNYPRKESPDLHDFTGENTFTTDPTKSGWFIKLDKSGQSLEKVLARPYVFYRLVYFTTYTNVETSDLCTVEGIGKEYIVYYLTGGGALAVDDLSDLLGTPSARSKEIGSGAPSSPVISVNMKGKASVIIGETSGQIFSQGAFSPSTNKAIMYWREVIP
jgi:type IV pilus assembly protein PilY1